MIKTVISVLLGFDTAGISALLGSRHYWDLGTAGISVLPESRHCWDLTNAGISALPGSWQKTYVFTWGYLTFVLLSFVPGGPDKFDSLILSLTPFR